MSRRPSRPFQSTFTEAPLEDQLPHPSRVLVDGLWEKFGNPQTAALLGRPLEPGWTPEMLAFLHCAEQRGREEVLNFLTDLAKSTPTV